MDGEQSGSRGDNAYLVTDKGTLFDKRDSILQDEASQLHRSLRHVSNEMRRHLIYLAQLSLDIYETCQLNTFSHEHLQGTKYCIVKPDLNGLLTAKVFKCYEDRSCEIYRFIRFNLKWKTICFSSGGSTQHKATQEGLYEVPKGKLRRNQLRSI